MKGHLKVIQFLLNREGIDINICNLKGVTPLMALVELGGSCKDPAKRTQISELIGLMVKKGAILSQQQHSNGNTVLIRAIELEYLEAILFLFNNSLNIDQMNNTGDTAKSKIREIKTPSVEQEVKMKLRIWEQSQEKKEGKVTLIIQKGKKQNLNPSEYPVKNQLQHTQGVKEWVNSQENFFTVTPPQTSTGSSFSR